MRKFDYIEDKITSLFRFHEYQARIKAEEEEEQRKIRERARIAEERSRRVYEEQKEEQRLEIIKLEHYSISVEEPSSELLLHHK